MLLRNNFLGPYFKLGLHFADFKLLTHFTDQSKLAYYLRDVTKNFILRNARSCMLSNDVE